MQVKATTPEAKPVSNGHVTKSVSKSDHFDESSFMLTVDGIDLNQNKFHYMKDLKSSTPLDTNIRVMVYVVEGLVIKGQVICDNDTRAFVSMSERLNSYFSEEPVFLKKDDCREGMLVIVSYAGEICRAVVMRYSIGAENADVYFIDYGNQENCKVADFKPLPSFAVDLPSMCREFTLSELPTDLQPSVKLSLSDHLKTLVLEKLVEAETRLLPGGSYELINTTEDGVNVNDAMLALYQELSAKSIHSTNGDKASGNQAVANTNVENIVIPVETLPKEQDFRIVVTDVKSPSSFFAQIIAADLSNITQLANLSEQLQNQPLSGASSFNASAGQVCVAFFPEDEMWYRASIDQVNADGSVKVSYFDYGNTVNLERSFLKPISPEFTSLPRQARKFALHNIQSSTVDGRWSDDAVALFKEKVSAEPCEVFCMAIVDDICHVQLYLPTDDICADQLLIDNGFAKSGSQAEPSFESQVPVAESQVPVAKPAENPAATADTVPMSIPTATPVSIKQIQLKRIEVKPDEVLHVVVVHVIDPYCFYVNIANRENIETLMEYGVILHEKSLVQLQDPQPGDICCALYTDGDWYRAKVITSSKDTSFVSFCDYGNDSEVPNSSLKIIPDEVTTLPAQAVKIKLSGVSPILENSPWSETAKEYFAGLISDKLFDMKVESVNGEVIAAALSSEEVKDVAEELINAGLALSSIQSLSSQKEKQICNNVPAQNKPTQLEVIETELVNPVVADQSKPVMKDEPKQIMKEELKPVPKDLQEQALIEQPKPVDADQQEADVTPIVSDEQKQASPKAQGPNKPPLDQTPQIGTAAEEKVQRSNNASLDKGLPDSNKEASASKNAKKGRAKNVDSSPDVFNGANEQRGVNNNFHQKRGSRGFARGRGRGYGNHFQNRDQQINSHKQAYSQQDMYGNYPYGPHMYPFPYPFMYPPNMGYFPPPLPGMPHPFQFDKNQPMNGKQDQQDPRSQEVSLKPADT
ncbi:MAG: hypothetical protein CMB97_01515 [Flavobacteriaceae bacterium]|nr:hypothetical protein [Flavobacteriaceae bacterium]